MVDTPHLQENSTAFCSMHHVRDWAPYGVTRT
jgi:hypothetical protein